MALRVAGILCGVLWTWAADFSETGSVLPVGAFGITAWGDFDNDSDPDLLFSTNPAGLDFRTYLCRNDGSGVMTPIEVGIPGVGQGSLAWGDYDRDGFMDVLVTGSTQPGPPFLVTQVYRSHGDASFGDAALPLPAVYEGSASWVDFDNNGALDLFVTGITDTSAATARNIAALFTISRDGGVTEVHTDLPGVESGSADWADYDRDGDLDLVLAGNTVAAVFRNDGAGRFVDAGVTLPAVGNPAVSWGDLDADGQPDILLAGDGVLAVFRNHGDGVFSGQDTGYALAYDPSIALGDYDNDGDLDLLLTGYRDQVVFEAVARILRNDGALTFTELDAGFEGIVRGQVSWVDFDTDGDLDVLLTGNGSARLYRNNLDRPNHVPSSPSDLRSTVNLDNDVILSWNPGSDVETKTGALQYNLRVGTTPGGSEIMTAHADGATGFRRLTGRGNGGHDTGWRLVDLPRGKYYWSVQAVDSAFAGSLFAPEATFEIANARPTISEIPDLESLPDRSSPEIPFEIADFETAAPDLAVSVSSSDWGLVPPENLVLGGIDKLRTLVITPLADRVGSTAITVTVTDGAGATRSRRFWFHVVRFSRFELEPPGMAVAGFALGDIDNDADLDLILTGATSDGRPETRLYRNEDSPGFELVATHLAAWYDRSVAWVDFDHDGDLDTALAGRLLRNDGSGGFTDGGPGTSDGNNGSVAWGDYNLDGWADLLNTGYYSVALYRNAAGGALVPTSAALPGVYEGMVSWVDFDRDGRLDILLSGGGLFGAQQAELYRNDPSGLFSAVGAGFLGIEKIGRAHV